MISLYITLIVAHYDFYPNAEPIVIPFFSYPFYYYIYAFYIDLLILYLPMYMYSTEEKTENDIEMNLTTTFDMENQEISAIEEPVNTVSRRPSFGSQDLAVSTVIPYEMNKHIEIDTTQNIPMAQPPSILRIYSWTVVITLDIPTPHQELPSYLTPHSQESIDPHALSSFPPSMISPLSMRKSIFPEEPSSVSIPIPEQEKPSANTKASKQLVDFYSEHSALSFESIRFRSIFYSIEHPSLTNSYYNYSHVHSYQYSRNRQVSTPRTETPMKKTASPFQIRPTTRTKDASSSITHASKSTEQEDDTTEINSPEVMKNERKRMKSVSSTKKKSKQWNENEKLLSHSSRRTPPTDMNDTTEEVNQRLTDMLSDSYWDL